jgi:hypothetical protein
MTQILVPALVGAVLFSIGLLHFRKVRASGSWPYTPGRILSAKVDSLTTRGGPDEADSTSFFPAIQYEYLVDNQRYLGDRIAFVGKSYASRKRAEEALQAFQVGASAWVFYDPAKPSKAVLERKASGGTMLMVLGGAIVLLAIVAALR